MIPHQQNETTMCINPRDCKWFRKYDMILWIRNSATMFELEVLKNEKQEKVIKMLTERRRWTSMKDCWRDSVNLKKKMRSERIWVYFHYSNKIQMLRCGVLSDFWRQRTSRSYLCLRAKSNQIHSQNLYCTKRESDSNTSVYMVSKVKSKYKTNNHYM